MKSSLEIAQDAVLRPIEEIAGGLGLEREEFEPYGRYKAKIDLSVSERLAGRAGRQADLRDGDDADAGGGGQDDDAGRSHAGAGPYR